MKSRITEGVWGALPETRVNEPGGKVAGQVREKGGEGIKGD